MMETELEKLSNVIDELWQLHQETRDRIAQEEIRKARGSLLILHDACQRVHQEMARPSARWLDPAAFT